MQSLPRTSLAESAVESIRTGILSRRWRVGDRLPNEASLSSMLSVSRGTVREAVRVLVSQGYLETRQGSGTYVRSTIDAARNLSIARRASIKDQFEARCALDVEAARLAAIRQTPDLIAGLRSLLLQRGECDGHDDREAFVQRDLAFHQAVVAASKNKAMIEIYAFLAASIQETIETVLCDTMTEPDMRAHAEIIDAIETGLPEEADAAVRRFMAPILATLDRTLM